MISYINSPFYNILIIKNNKLLLIKFIEETNNIMRYTLHKI